MKFGWLNLTGALIVALMMIPNIIYAARPHDTGNRCTVKAVLFLEQVGRYGSMALMVLPVLAGEFGFVSSAEFVVWAALCAAMLLAYFVCWGIYFRKPSLAVAMWLAILPATIFVLRGVFLRHWLLTAFGVVFAVAHIYITLINNKPTADE